MMLIPKSPRIEDRKHLERVAAMNCCCCKRAGGVSHHLLRVPGKGMGIKAGDNWVINLCHVCHDSLHRNGNEVKFLAQYGIDGKELAKQLYEGRNEKN
jgi:hypothetical protein